MARNGVTYEQVAAAAEALEAEQPGSATISNVRLKLGGTGSSTTLHKYLAEWRDEKPKTTAPTIVMPAEVNRALSAWVVQVATEARAKTEEGLANSQVDADELARAAGQLEREREDLLAQVADLTTQSDQAHAIARTREDEIARLQADAERERDLAGKAQVDAAQARLKVESQAEHLVDMRMAAEKMAAALDAERTGRTEAERLAAVTGVQLESARTDLEAARAQVETLRKELATVRERFEQELTTIRERLERSAVDLQAEHEKAALAGVQLEAAKADLEAARVQVTTLLQEVAAGRDQVEKMRVEHQTRSDEDRRALELARGQVAAASLKQVELQADLRAALVENEALKSKLKTTE